MASAQTFEACAAAWETRYAYLKLHPEDKMFFMDAGEMLRMTQGALEYLRDHPDDAANVSG